MLTGPNVILALKVAVAAVTVLLLASLAALLLGKVRLHGRINVVFFILTVTALLALEVVVRFINPQLFDYFDDGMRLALFVHLCFSIPSALLLPVMLYTGLRGHYTLHLTLAFVFSVLWIGTFVTGIFFLPHTLPSPAP
jgi:uncharacterized membrane protein YozB (DUF420 family)